MSTNLAYFNNKPNPVMVEDRGSTWADVRPWSATRQEWRPVKRIRIETEQRKTPTALWVQRAATAPQVG